MAGPHRPHQAEVPVEPALVRPVAAVPAGLAGRHARRRLPDLRRARRPRRRPVGDPGLQPRPVGRHAVRHQRRDDRLRRHERGHDRVHARARRGDPGRGLRVPGRRGADPGRVREDAAVPPGPGEVGLAPRDAGLAGRHRRGAVLPRRRRHRPAERADVAVRLQVRRLLRRSAGGARPRQAQPRRRHAALPGQRRSDAKRADEPVERRRALRPRQRDVLPRDAGDRDRDRPGRQREGVVHRRRRDEPVVHVPGRVRHRAPGAGLGGRGLLRRLAGEARRDVAAVPVLLHERAGGERGRVRRL